jgi:hypothetical protein
MTYTEQGDRVTLEMTREDYATLILALGFAGGSALDRGEPAMFWAIIDFANRMNATNPNFIAYEIPEGYRCKAKTERTPKPA